MKNAPAPRRRFAGSVLLLTTCLPLLLVGVLLVARTQGKGPVQVSLKAGGTYAGLAGEDLKQLAGPDYTTRLDNRYLAYHTGAALRIPVSRHGVAALQPEVLLNRRGYRIAADRTAGLATGETQCSFKQTVVAVAELRLDSSNAAQPLLYFPSWYSGASVTPPGAPIEDWVRPGQGHC